MTTYALFCDNFNTCKGSMYDRGGEARTVARARAKGWHIWYGETMGGATVDVKLCEKYVGTNRSRLPAAPKVVPGQMPLF